MRYICSIIPSFIHSVYWYSRVPYLCKGRHKGPVGPPGLKSTGPLPSGVSPEPVGPTRDMRWKSATPSYTHMRSCPRGSQASRSSGWNPGHSTLREKQAPGRLRSSLCGGGSQGGRQAGRAAVTHHPKKNKSMPIWSMACLSAPPVTPYSFCHLSYPLISSRADPRAFMESFLWPWCGVWPSITNEETCSERRGDLLGVTQPAVARG